MQRMTASQPRVKGGALPEDANNMTIRDLVMFHAEAGYHAHAAYVVDALQVSSPP